MKIINRIIAVLLSLLMCIGTAAFADENGGFEPTEYNEAIRMLEDLGIVEKDEYTVYDASRVMTRGEFAALSLEILGLKDDAQASSFSPKYKDVDSLHKYAKEINFAASLGLFSGVSADEFSPDTPIYISQAVKVAVNMLGYGPVALSKGGYPAGYYAVASQVGLTDGVNMNNTSGALRGDVMVLMYNTLFADMVQTDGYTDDGASYRIKKDETILSEYHNITESEGIVTATPLYSLSGSVTEKDYIEIDGKAFYTQSERATDSFGLNVKYYYKTVNGKKQILTLREEDNSSIVIKADDDYDFDALKRMYTLDNGDKKYTFKLAENFDAIYNMSLADRETASDFIKILTPKSGTLTLIDNNKDNYYDIVIVSEGRTVIFGSYDSYGNKIFDKKDRAYDISLDDYDNFSVVGSDGSDAEPEKVTSGSVITVYESRDKKALRAVVSAVNKTVKITAADSDYVYTASSKYVYSSSARCENNIKPGSSYVLYFDVFNEIVYYEIASAKDTGYILKCGNTGSGINNPDGVQMLLPTGVAAMNFADKVKVETASGKKTYSSDKVADALKTITDSMYGAAVNPDGRLFVQYTANSDRKITSITIPYVIKTEDEYNNPPSNYSFFKLDYVMETGADIGSPLNYTPENKSAGMWMLFDSECGIWYVPEFGNTQFEADKCGRKDLSTLKRDDPVYFTKSFNGTDNQLEAYSTDSELEFVDAVVWVSKSGTSSSIKDAYDNNMLVTSVSRTLSDKGEDLLKIDGIMNKNTVTLYTDDDSVISADNFKNTEIDGTKPVINSSKISIAAGDIIKYGLDSSGYVEKVALIYDGEAHDICYKDTKFTRYSVQYRYTCGTVKNIKGGYLFLNLHDTSMSSYIAEPHSASAFARIYVYDSDQDTARIGSVSDAAIGDYVFVCDNYRKPIEIVIYKGGK